MELDSAIPPMTRHSDRPAPAELVGGRAPRLLFVVTEDWYFCSHRLLLAKAAREAGYEVAVATRVDRHGGQIEDAGLRLFPLALKRSGRGAVSELRTIGQLMAIYRRERPDLIHHVAMKPVIYGSLAARLAGVKGVVNALGGLGFVFRSTGTRARLMRRMLRPALRSAFAPACTRVIVQNEDDRGQILSLRLADADRVCLIPGSGVDLSLYPSATAHSNEPLVILPARLLRDKGVEEFVAAAQALRAEGIKARFALVGRPDSANPQSVSQAQVDEWVDRGAVEAWGWQDDMPGVYGQAQIVCLPTYHEGLPKTLLEAAASQCAIVTTDIPGCNDIVRNGETGWLVPPKRVPELIAALRTAIANPELRARYGASARQRVEAHYAIGRVVADTLHLYRNLLTQKHQEHAGPAKAPEARQV